MASRDLATALSMLSRWTECKTTIFCVVTNSIINRLDAHLKCFWRLTTFATDELRFIRSNGIFQSNRDWIKSRMGDVYVSDCLFREISGGQPSAVSAANFVCLSCGCWFVLCNMKAYWSCRNWADWWCLCIFCEWMFCGWRISRLLRCHFGGCKILIYSVIENIMQQNILLKVFCECKATLSILQMREYDCLPAKMSMQI